MSDGREMEGGSSSKIEFLIWLSQVMGGLCSRSSSQDDDMVFVSKTGGGGGGGNVILGGTTNNGGGGGGGSTNGGSSFTTAPVVGETMERNMNMHAEISGNTNDEEFYDGIPRFNDTCSHNKSRSGRSKVSEVGSRLGKAGTIGFGKAVEVLDTLGSSMTNLNAGSGFVSASAIKGNEISILAFEVANTIVKGYNLLQFLSSKNIRHLKEEVLLSEAVQDLVSKDMDELLWIVVSDKRQELKVFSDEVIRFGNRSKNPQWHNLERYFEKEANAPKQSRDEAESTMEHLMTLVQFTAELYHELHALDRFEQDYQHKCTDEDQKGDTLAFLKAEVKTQKKQIKHIKKRSLWSRSLEEIMEMLVDMVQFLNSEINDVFGAADGHKPLVGHKNNHQRLGPAGLALHYANIVLQIDTLVSRSNSMPANTRDALYQGLPPNIKSALRSKLSSFHVAEEITVADIKDEMEKTLHWLVPIATNTSKAHHGFGWVGEWANTGSEVRKTFQAGIMRIETFHHADKDKVESYILELLLWLQQLAIRSKTNNDPGKAKPATKCNQQKTINQPTNSLSPPLLTMDEQNILQNISEKTQMRRLSKSLDFDTVKTRITRSYSYSSRSSRRSSEVSFSRICSKLLPVIDFDIDKERALDVIDRVDVIRNEKV